MEGSLLSALLGAVFLPSYIQQRPQLEMRRKNIHKLPILSALRRGAERDKLMQYISKPDRYTGGAMGKTVCTNVNCS